MPANTKRMSYAPARTRGTGLPLPPDRPGCVLPVVLAFAYLGGISFSGTSAGEMPLQSTLSNACPACPSSTPQAIPSHELEILAQPNTPADPSCVQEVGAPFAAACWSSSELHGYGLIRARLDDARGSTLRCYLATETRRRCRELLRRIGYVGARLSIPALYRPRDVDSLSIGCLSTSNGRFRAVQRYRSLFGFRGSALHERAYYLPRRSWRELPRLHFRLNISREE